MKGSQSTDLKDEEIYNSVHRVYRRELRISKSRYEKVAEYINEVFLALANYDARFHFDPMSIDDYQCEIVSPSELRVICELKHLSKFSYEVDGEASDGRVQIRLRDDVHRYDIVSWDDVCSKRNQRTDKDFLNTRTVLEVFTTALGRAVRDVWNKHRNVGLVYRVSGNQARIYVDIPDTGFFTVSLIPAIKLTESAVKGLDTKSELLKGLGEKEEYFSTIYATAQPNRYFQDESWQLSFTTLENRIMNAEQFICGRVCLHALRHLLLSSKTPRCGIRALTLSHLQLAVIQQYAQHPEAKDWTPAKFIKRLTGTMMSLKSCLREGTCVNQFSGANVFAQFDLKSLKVLAKDVEHANTKCREKLARVSV
ncbi:uncharacterized protein LOC114515773 isoform X2 [Dendronephthya gigantea]|uniref:uncharacterized protein LOC114515773 isoform X2 n=1 Tax=Dendronephthya gigantea TaxID=151771 RepID=UPI00106A2E42|nr:uncharacterized protein LOC114515773 isoform X2 [Dendronephthya gigantea]